MTGSKLVCPDMLRRCGECFFAKDSADGAGPVLFPREECVERTPEHFGERDDVVFDAEI